MADDAHLEQQWLVNIVLDTWLLMPSANIKEVNAHTRMPQRDTGGHLCYRSTSIIEGVIFDLFEKILEEELRCQ